jgi:hypothetical protein
MPLWTVHSKVDEPALIRTRSDEVRFVREGFNWPAFLVPLLWLIVKGMWIALLLALAVEILVIAAATWLNFSDTVATLLGLGINLVMGFAGNDLYRWTLARGGFHEVGLAAGSDLDEAELRYFSGLPEAPQPSAPPPAKAPLPAALMPDALGLFPQAGGAR